MELIGCSSFNPLEPVQRHIMTLPSEHRVPLTGYSDRLSARPGETIAFKLSAHGVNQAHATTVRSHLVQCISADPNPAGLGIIERPAHQWYEAAQHTVSEQAIHAGSYAICKCTSPPTHTAGIKIQITIWPTRLDRDEQCILSLGGLSIGLKKRRILARIAHQSILLSEPLQHREWVEITLQISQRNNRYEASLQRSTHGSAQRENVRSLLDISELATLFSHSRDLHLACRAVEQSTYDHFNGKIEGPTVHFLNANQDRIQSMSWDLSRDMSSRSIPSNEQPPAVLQLKNYPTRAMRSHQWSGVEMCWRHAPQQYAAIHFHEDDIVDFQWRTTFSYTVPQDMPSGVYIMRISDGTHEDALPFFVCAPKGQPRNRLCMLVPTFTYAIYGNHARPNWTPEWQEKVHQWGAYPYNPAQFPGYGLSTYNNHCDGSGICHASHLRPLFNLRPGYLTFGNVSCSGLRHFPADSHLWAWLDAMNLEFDVITDSELHNEGASCLQGYDMLLTSSHPEYHTTQTLDALMHYRDSGGHLSYLGGNGFYWRIALHPEQHEILEIRRAEAGIRAWAAEPGEYYHAFDGQYGGLWRRNGRPPQILCGLGFTAQGEFNGSAYRRCNYDAEFGWVFDGIESEVLGNFGFSGGGAAGFELDRADPLLGTPAHATILARSENHSDDFILVPEEMLTHLTTLPGPSKEALVHADILWFDLPDGGSVFAVGSITFCGSLPYNQFNNSISRLLFNVVQHVLDQH